MLILDTRAVLFRVVIGLFDKWKLRVGCPPLHSSKKMSKQYFRNVK